MHTNKKAHHVWILETDNKVSKFILADKLHSFICSINRCYNDLALDGILKEPEIYYVAKGTFAKWMLSKNRTGQQQKMPRLSNDNSLAKELSSISCSLG